jgi:chromosome segregation ATPase
MKNRIGLILLILICLGLIVGLVVTKKQATDQHQQDTVQIDTISNNLTKANVALDDQKKVNVTLEKDMDTQKQTFEKSLTELTNNFTEVSANLAKTEANLRASEQEVKQRDTKIADLEAQNQLLDKRAVDLSNELTNLTTQIDDTKRKLAASEGDKAFLQKELHRLMGEKAELERQFNDLTVLRAQVAKLRAEHNIAQRLEWARQGLFASADQKGAQKLMQGLVPPKSEAQKPTYDLNVEVSSDGSVRVIPPLGNTNSVAPTNRPAPR